MKRFDFFRIVIGVLLIFFLTLILTTCNVKSDQPTLIVGEAKLPVPGGNIWYKISGTGKNIPLVLLHGGPGYSSFYLKAFEELGNDRQVIRYDQLGAGKSDHISDTALFTIDHFVRELDSLRRFLGLKHGWGILGVQFRQLNIIGFILSM